MRHDLRLAGVAFEVRPVEIGDAAFIFDLRRDPELTRYVHAVPAHQVDQEAWLDRYFERPDDLYFLVVRRSTGRPEGTVGLYDIQDCPRTAEWGRWILRRDSMAAVESAWLIYRMAFEILGLDSVYCRTVAANQRVVSFHNSCGLSTRDGVSHTVSLGDEAFEMVEHCLTREGWKRVQGRLGERAAAVASMVDR